MLSRVPMLQNQHIMGWGAGNPEPAPGRNDFRDLDRRIRFMSGSQALPIITLCCSPDWMKGGSSGRTDWTQLETAPRREHFDDYAKLAATVARRYPTVKHFMVWNELKGFWNTPQNRWDIEGYTELYNKVYDALKAVDKDIKVGGPYVSVGSTTVPERGAEIQGRGGASSSATWTRSGTGSRTRRAPTSSSSTAPRSPRRPGPSPTSSPPWASSALSPGGSRRRAATCRSGGPSGTSSPPTATGPRTVAQPSTPPR